MMTTTKYHTKSGSVYVVKRSGPGNPILVMREKLGDHHTGERRDRRVEVDKLEEFRKAIRVVSGDKTSRPCVGAPLRIYFDEHDDRLITSPVTAIEELI